MDRLMIGLDLLKDLENLVSRVNKNLKEDQDRQKIYTDMFHIDKEYKVGRHVLYLNVNGKRNTLGR